jgi:thiol:disulfide interchange protein
LNCRGRFPQFKKGVTVLTYTQSGVYSTSSHSGGTQHDTGKAFAITSFVLGIASILSSWTFIAPIIGLILGAVALRRDTRERALALWGVWLNGIMLALTVAAVLLVVLLGGAGFLAYLMQGTGS